MIVDPSASKKVSAESQSFQSDQVASKQVTAKVTTQEGTQLEIHAKKGEREGDSIIRESFQRTFSEENINAEPKTTSMKAEKPQGHIEEMAEEVDTLFSEHVAVEKNDTQKADHEAPSLPAAIMQEAEGGYMLKDLCEDIKQTSTTPQVEESTKKLTAELRSAITEQATQKLHTAILHHDPDKILENGVIGGLRSHFWSATEQLERELYTNLNSPPKNLDPNTAGNIVVGIVGAARQTLENKYRQVHSSVQKLLVSHQSELEGLNPKEYREKVSSIINSVVEKEMQTFLFDLSKFSGEVSENVQLIKRNNRIGPSFEKITQDDINGLISLVRTKIEKQHFVPSRMGANVVELIFKNAKQASVDLGSIGIFDDLDKLDSKTAALVVGRTLRNLAMYVGSPEYNYAVTVLRKKYPETVQYIAEWRQYPDEPHHYVMSHDGIRKIISMLKEKGKLGTTPCIMCEDISEISEKLESLYNGTADFTRVGFVLQETRHYVPIFAEKKDGKLRIFSPEGLPYQITDALNAKKIPCKVFIEKTSMHRQKDGDSCPVFSLRDLSQLCQHPELMDEIESYVSEKSSENSESESTVVEEVFKSYPQALMNSSQSLSYIDKKDQKYNRTVHADLQARGKIQSEPLEYRPLDMKDINITMANRRLKYEQILYSVVIARAVQGNKE